VANLNHFQEPHQGDPSYGLCTRLQRKSVAEAAVELGYHGNTAESRWHFRSLEAIIEKTSPLQWWWNKYLLIPTDTYWYLLIPTDTYWYLLIHTDTYWYILIPTDTYCILVTHHRYSLPVFGHLTRVLSLRLLITFRSIFAILLSKHGSVIWRKKTEKRRKKMCTVKNEREKEIIHLAKKISMLHVTRIHYNF
jgi:hypothetical protein